jgi:hypothetical protein
MRLTPVLALLAAFATSLGVTLVGCSSPDCGCTEVPARPEPQAPLSTLMLVFEDENGQPRVVRPKGSIEVTGAEVLISYEDGDAMVSARYDVHSR